MSAYNSSSSPSKTIKIIELKPTSVEVFVNRGNAYDALEKFE